MACQRYGGESFTVNSPLQPIALHSPWWWTQCFTILNLTKLPYPRAGRSLVPTGFGSLVPMDRNSPAWLHGNVKIFIISSKWSVTYKRFQGKRAVQKPLSKMKPVKFSAEVGATLQIFHRSPKEMEPGCFDDPATNGHEFNPSSCWKIDQWLPFWDGLLSMHWTLEPPWRWI